MRTAVNRALLAVIGVLLLAGGLLVLLGGLDLERRWNLALPSWWPLDDPDQPLLSRAGRTRWTDRGWWWPAVIAGLGVLVTLSLWWLVAQLRERRLGQVHVAVPGSGDRDGDGNGDGNGDGAESGAGAARLRARALEDAVAAEIRALDGVDRARVTLHGRRRAPRARIAVTLAANASPADLVDRLDRDPLLHARDSAGLPDLPADIRLRSDRHPATRVE